MKEKFTKLMAAFVLLVFMAPSLVVWGQTRETMDYTQLYSADFTTVANHSYTQNHTFTLNGKSWTSSVSQVAGGVFYLGCNSNNAAKGILGNNSTFSDINAALIATGDHYISETNHAYALRFDNAYNNVTKVAFNWSGGNNAFQVYLFGDSGSGYVMLGHTNYAISGQDVSGSVEWTGDATNYTKFAIVARPGTSSSNATNKTLRAASFYVYETSGGFQTTYTVTLADDNTTLAQATPGASVTLPTRSAIGDYTFAGWSETNVEDETTTDPTIIPAGSYTPTDDITLYPVYTRTETGSGPTNVTANVIIADYAYAHNWSNGEAYQPLVMDENISIGGTISGNNFKYYTSDYSWRFYTGGSFTISANNGATLTSVTLTFSGGLSYNNNSISSGTAVNVSGASAVISCTSNAKITSISVSYVISGGTTTYYWSNPGAGPVITATVPAALAYNATGGEFSYSILNPETGVTLNAASNSDWITDVAVDATNSTVTFSTSTNMTYTQRTGTITLSYTGATDKVVTITQGAAPDPVITAIDVAIAFDASSGSIAYSITNEPDPAGTMTAVVSGGTIANLTIGAIENNTVAFTCSANNTTSDRTATVTLTYTYSNSLTVTKNVTVTQAASTADYATLPFDFDGGRDDIANTVGLTQDGLDADYGTSPYLKFNTTGDCLILHFNERPGNLSYDIKGNSFSDGTFKVQVSADGENFTDFITYTDLPITTDGPMHVSINHLASDVRYIKWVYTEKVEGNVALGNIKLAVYEDPQPYNLSIENADTYTIVVRGITNGHSISVNAGELVTVEVRLGDGYVLDEVLVLDENEQQVTLTPLSNGYWSFYMPDSDVVISAIIVEAHAPAYYNLATSIESGKKYIIVGKKNGVYYAMGAQKTNSNNNQTNRAAKLISVDGTVAEVRRSDVYDFVINLESEGVYSFYDVNAQGYLYTPTANTNTLMTEETLDENGKWTITFDSETGAAIVVANEKTMQFNPNSILFSSYKSASQDAIYLYKIDDTFTFDIVGYTGERDHYYLIASPVTVDPATVEGMTTGDYDLYYFDPSQEKEWINYKGDAALNHPGGFWLEPGKGYLYAKKATSDHPTYSFSLTGNLYTGNGVIYLEPGWNLIGNPFRQATELDIENYYVINETEQGSELVAGDLWQVQPLEGIFVYGDDEATAVTFNRIRSAAWPAGLSLNLTKGRGLVDRAIVRFGEGKQLPKFQLNENSTKLYIPQGNQDFAVVRSAGEGEMPVSFKAEKDGTYTLSMNAEEVTFDYLHLIDNMTGMDVDLLQTPSYTFEARTSDYTSRFRLIFSANDGDSVVDETFAFFNGSGWTVSNLGEATLQVVDVMGRVVSSQSINGNATINLNEAAGIYMFRLINGENVKVQKVVVR